jgi:hypothetical protein
MRGYLYPESLARDTLELKWAEFSDTETESDRARVMNQIKREAAVHSAGTAWERSVNSLRELMFPAKHFPVMTQWDRDHPANVVASACLLFEVRTLEPERLIPEFELKPMYFLYPPPSESEMRDLYEALGERDYYRSVVEDLLADDADQLKSVLHEAQSRGALRLHEQMPRDRWLSDLAEWWWYLPITSQTRPEDMRNAASSIVKLTDEVFGAAPLDRLILELKDAGRSQAQVSRALGVSIDTVKRAWRSSRDAS